MIDMPAHPPGPPRVAGILGLAVALLGLLLLVTGWSGAALLGPLRAAQPMAPMTCGLLLLLGGALFLSAPPGSLRPWTRGYAPLAWAVLAGALAVPAAAALGWRTLPTAQVSLLTAWGLAAAAAAALLGGAEPRTAGPERRQAGALLGLLPMLLGAYTLLSYGVGIPLLYGTGRVMMPLQTAAALAVLGLALVLRGGADTWPGSMFSVREGPGGRRVHKLPMTVFLVLSLGLMAGATLFLRSEIQGDRRALDENLQAVAELKVSQITRWREELLRDVEAIRRPRLARLPLVQFLEGGPGAPPEAEVRTLLKAVAGDSFSRVDLHDRAGRPRCAADGVLKAISPGHLEVFRTALGRGAPVLTDLHLDDGEDGPRMSVWLGLGEGSAGAPAGVLHFQVDPRQFLFPRLQAWPGSSPTAESTLVRREGGEVLFLNDLRHRAGTALRQRLPIAAAPDRLAAQAALGNTGPTSGTDYRGVAVAGWILPVPGTSWVMVVKQDESEIYGPVQRQMAILSAVLLALVLVMALATGQWTRRQDALLASARHRAVREAYLQAERFRSLMNQAGDVILLMDGAYRITDANTRACQVYGLPPQQLREASLADLTDPGQVEAQRSSLETLRGRGEGRFETLHRDGDGKPFPVEVSAKWVADEGPPVLLAFLRDISLRKEQEQRILRLQKLYAALSQVNQAITRERTRESLLQCVCEVLVKFGPFHMAWVAWAEPGDALVTKVASHGDRLGYLDHITVRLDRAPESKGPIGSAILRGEPAVFNDFIGTPGASPWHDEALRCGLAAAGAFPIRCRGAVCGAIAVYSEHRGLFGADEEALMVETAGDVSFALDHLHYESVRQAGEEALQASERFLREAEEAGQVGTFVWDIERDRWQSSPTLDRIFGLGEGYAKDLAGWLALVAPDFREEMQAYVGRIIARREPFDLEYPVLRASDQSRRWVYGRGRIDWSEAGAPLRLSGTIQDVTSLREAGDRQRAMESRLQQAQRLESLGKLAGGVAHDMNNVLGAILSLATTHRPQQDPEGPLAKALDTIATACLRGRGVVKGLLYFAHRDLEESRPLDLNQVVGETVHLLAYTTLKRVRLEVNLEEGLPPLLGDAGAISHALMNLCVNAVDAMEGAGTIVIRTSRLSDGGFLLSVRDTGPGMDAGQRERALEPFYTTKPVGQGTGLGLSMALGTMKAHDGTLEILGEPGQGTEVRMTFPASREAAPAPEAPAHAPGAEPSRRLLRILLVDDDELIREAVVPTLEVMGHHASAAPGGEEALRRLAGGLEVDLVILDMNMPGMNGAETLGRLLVLRPEQAVLMATGYTDLDLAALLEGHPKVSSIRKPFTVAELNRKLAEMGLGGA